MAKPTISLDGEISRGKAKSAGIPQRGEKRIAQTVKLDQETFEALSIHRAKTRQTAQAIIEKALKIYLDRQ